MSYIDTGQGAPLVLLHAGMSNNVDSWGQQLRPLSETNRVIAPDTRGQGRTTDGGGQLSYEMFGDDFTALLSQLSINRAVFAGISDGAAVALDLSVRRPDLVQGLVLISAPFDVQYSPETLAMMNQLQPQPTDPGAGNYPSFEQYSDFYHRLVDLWKRKPPTTREQAANIRVPTLILHGDHDEEVPVEEAQELAATIPGAEFHLVPNSSHNVTGDQPDAVTSAIKSFIQFNK
ncbi:alpha/beta fold hydrolase [Nocardia africana]|uniref:Alpha/beta fold hydrolase n=1 Tax=Nocardia africana TaxID=134964 RepID=A0ABW6NCF7_9NOCA